MSDPFVVKVQKSLATNMGHGMILIYDASREVWFEDRLTPEMEEAVPSPKEYFWALINDARKIELQGKPLRGKVNGETPEQMFDRYTFPVMNTERLRQP